MQKRADIGIDVEIDSEDARDCTGRSLCASKSSETETMGGFGLGGRSSQYQCGSRIL